MAISSKRMKEGLIGVIVPVYKVEKYVTECIESILAQTYTDFRLILVDDGTPDNAGKICDEYAQKDPRITVIHQENAGVTRARARGVEEASDCEFITFVDSDDTITEDALEQMHFHMNDNANIVIIAADEHVPLKDGRISATEWRKLLLRDISICNSPWGKLFRRTLFDKEAFNIPKEIVICEDLLMNIYISFANTKEVIILPKKIYNYRIHNESAMHTFRRSIGSEELFYENLRKIVPDDAWLTYAQDTLNTRLARFRMFCGYKYSVKDIFQTNYYKSLRKDILDTGYQICGLDRILFFYKNAAVRFIAINIRKLHNLLNR